MRSTTAAWVAYMNESPKGFNMTPDDTDATSEPASNASEQLEKSIDTFLDLLGISEEEYETNLETDTTSLIGGQSKQPSFTPQAKKPTFTPQAKQPIAQPTSINPVKSQAPTVEQPPVNTTTFNQDMFGTNSTDDCAQRTMDFNKSVDSHEVKKMAYDPTVYSVISQRLNVCVAELKTCESIIANAKLKIAQDDDLMLRLTHSLNQCTTLNQLNNAYKQGLKEVHNAVIGAQATSSELQTRITNCGSVPADMAIIKGMYENCNDASAKSKLHIYIYGTVNGITGGTTGLLKDVHAQYQSLRFAWRSCKCSKENLTTVYNNCNARIVNELSVDIPLNTETQEAAREAFSNVATNSSVAMYIGVKELHKIVMTAITEFCGGDLGMVQSFALSDSGEIQINDNLLNLSNSIDITADDLVKIPEVFRKEIRDGKWGCAFDFRAIYKFYNLRVLNLEYANKRKWDALKDLCINNGKWGQLFKRKSKLPYLQEVRLPEGVITPENSSIFSQFKSNKEYEEYSNKHAPTKFQSGTFTKCTNVNTAEMIAEHNSQALSNTLDSIKTFKDMLWSKPLPRTLIKTLGYGAGIPLYWGVMTALGPVGLVMGALGIGVMARHEIREFKNS